MAGVRAYVVLSPGFGVVDGVEEFVAVGRNEVVRFITLARKLLHERHWVEQRIRENTKGEGIMAISLAGRPALLSDDGPSGHSALRALARLRVGLQPKPTSRTCSGFRARTVRPLVVGPTPSQGLDGAASGAVRAPPSAPGRLLSDQAGPAHIQGLPRQTTAPEGTWASPAPLWNRPRRARPDPQGVRHRPGRADRGRVTSTVGAINRRRNHAAAPRKQDPEENTAVGWKRTYPAIEKRAAEEGRGDLLVR